MRCNIFDCFGKIEEEPIKDISPTTLNRIINMTEKEKEMVTKFNLNYLHEFTNKHYNEQPTVNSVGKKKLFLLAVSK
jgi:hypothetical protein